jgi:hypothetical protein
MRRLILIALMPLMLIQAALADRPLPQSLLREAPDLKLLGSGEMRWFGLHLYDATLWSSGQPWSPKQVFALDLMYAREISSRRLVESSIAEMRRLGIKDEEKLARWAGSMSQVFPDVKKDERIVGVHLPGKGASFYHQGRPTGTIEDVEFSDMFFAIWLDPRTREPTLRKALLGER